MYAKVMSHELEDFGGQNVEVRPVATVSLSPCAYREDSHHVSL